MQKTATLKENAYQMDKIYSYEEWCELMENDSTIELKDAPFSSIEFIKDYSKAVSFRKSEIIGDISLLLN